MSIDIFQKKFAPEQSQTCRTTFFVSSELPSKGVKTSRSPRKSQERELRTQEVGGEGKTERIPITNKNSSLMRSQYQTRDTETKPATWKCHKKPRRRNHYNSNARPGQHHCPRRPSIEQETQSDEGDAIRYEDQLKKTYSGKKRHA